jgi:hypothetical protein
MMLRTSARGPLAPDLVWERYAQPALWPSWAPQIRDVDAPDRLAAGADGRVHALLGVTADFVVDTWDDAAREWSWTARTRLPAGLPGPTLYLVHGVEASGTGSRAWLRIRGAAPVVASYVGPARLALHRLVR